MVAHNGFDVTKLIAQALLTLWFAYTSFLHSSNTIQKATHAFSMAANKGSCYVHRSDKLVDKQEDNAARLHCPSIPVTSVTGNRNRTVILQILPPRFRVLPTSSSCAPNFTNATTT